MATLHIHDKVSACLNGYQDNFKKSHLVAGTLIVNFPTGMVCHEAPTGIYPCSKVGYIQQK